MLLEAKCAPATLLKSELQLLDLGRLNDLYLGYLAEPDRIDLAPELADSIPAKHPAGLLTSKANIMHEL